MGHVVRFLGQVVRAPSRFIWWLIDATFLEAVRQTSRGINRLVRRNALLIVAGGAGIALIAFYGIDGTVHALAPFITPLIGIGIVLFGMRVMVRGFGKRRKK